MTGPRMVTVIGPGPGPVRPEDHAFVRVAVTEALLADFGYSDGHVASVLSDAVREGVRQLREGDWGPPAPRLDGDMRTFPLTRLARLRVTRKPGGRLLFGLGLSLPRGRELVCGAGLENRNVRPYREAS